MLCRPVFRVQKNFSNNIIVWKTFPGTFLSPKVHHTLFSILSHNFRTLYSAVVAENSPSGTLLATVAASDADEGANARQIHYLSGESAELFSVGVDTGEIRTAIPLDRLDSEPIQDHGWSVTTICRLYFSSSSM